MSLTDEQEPTFEIYAGDLLNFMRYCKIWKADTFSSGKNLIVVLTVSVLLSSEIAVITATLIDFKNASEDLTTFAAYVGPLCLQCIGLMKWTYCIWKIGDIAKLIEILKRCHCLCMKINKNDLGWKKYKSEMNNTRLHYVRFIYGWLWLCIYGILHWCTNPIILEIRENGFAKETMFMNENSTSTRTRYFPYLGWRPWNVDNNYGYFSLFFIQFIGAMSSAIGSVTYDVFYITTLMIICANLRYLNDSLIDTKDNDVSLRATTASLDLEVKLKRCVDHHAEILTFLDALELLASPAMFVQCFENIIVLCLVSLEASTIEINGLQIADSAYLCSWEQVTCDNTRNNDKRGTRRINFLIQMFILRSQRSILLTGGPFYVLSLETFKSVVGLAMSNSVILRQVVEDRA